MRAATIAAAAFVIATFCAAAQAAPPKLPATVANDLREIAADCTGAGGKAMTGDAVKAADLNGDSREDFVLFVGWINCDGAPGIYGDREKGVLVYAGDGAGGASKAFGGPVYDAKIEGTGPASKLWLTVSGAQCGKKPAADFASGSFCDRALAWNGKTGQFDWAPVSSVRTIE
jgi:hypothetical protein